MGYEETLSLLHSFYSFDYVLKLPVTSTTKLLKKAIEKREEKKVWDIWLIKFSKMDKKSYISFDKFFKKLKEPINQTPTDDILKEIEAIRKAQRKEGE